MQIRYNTIRSMPKQAEIQRLCFFCVVVFARSLFGSTEKDHLQIIN